MTLAAGDRLGPYELVAPLGAGGMGEVWRARDPRLGREVAVKLLPAEVAGDPERRGWFEREARATAALAHPNVVAIFDVGVDGGRPYLVEELLEGETLGRRIRAGDLTVGRSVALAVQVAHGLAVAHERGIVHRDLKPDNLFLTRDGVVKILDLGLAVPAAAVEAAGGEATEPSPEGMAVRAAGTPAYMAPEQARGRAVDHRADLFALGAVLYEMLAGARPFVGDSRADLVASILTRDPPPLPPSVPRGVQAVVLRCMEKRPEDRYTSARDVAYALEAALESTPERVMAARSAEPRPYPGLAAFTEADAESFFGREEEVAALWRRIPERKLLGLIGPSGAGKTSFVRAGLVSHAPPRWRCLVATPGQSPFAGLARALAPHFAGEPEAIAELIDLHRPEVGPGLVARWTEGCDGALVVVDQAEELFTQSGDEVQTRFAELLGRLAELDGVHVLLSLRDDFLFRCHAFPALRPVFQDLTPLGPPEGDALRRALVEPARRLGFAFENEALVEEMLEAVAEERGALPLLAFAMSRLWEERDQERKLLTRDAYARIGGVAGALAQHAEATLERLGEGNVALVRELFRNLATGQRTRCVLEWHELLSVFPPEQRGEAERVLAVLVDARLLTSFELEGADGTWQHRVEVVHESLLRSWPRLQRWQTQDEEGALLRDQLRQAARLWDERGRPEDLLWTGNAVTEYRLWRERYPGGRSAVEEAFGEAIVGLAGRRRGRRRLILTLGTFVALVLSIVMTALWWRGARESRRVEAQNLFLEGKVDLQYFPVGSFSSAVTSLETADDPEVRRFALEALWRAPMPQVVWTDSDPSVSMDFSSDSRWMAAGYSDGTVRVWSASGGDPVVWQTGLGPVSVRFAPDSRTLATIALREPLFRFWGLDGSARTEPENGSWTPVRDSGDAIASATMRRLLRIVRRPGAEIGSFGEWTVDPSWIRRLERLGAAGGPAALDPSGSRLVVGRDRELLVVTEEGATPRIIGRNDLPFEQLAVHPDGSTVAAIDSEGKVQLWSAEGDGSSPSRVLVGIRESMCWDLAFDPTGSILVAVQESGKRWVWGLGDPPGADPLRIVGGWAGGPGLQLAFPPSGRWVATAGGIGGVGLWPIDRRRYGYVLRGHAGPVSHLGFSPDGRWLVSAAIDGVVRLWPLNPASSQAPRELCRLRRPIADSGQLDVSPDGRFVALTTGHGAVQLAPLDGGPGFEIPLFRGRVSSVAVGHGGAVVAAGGGEVDPSEAVIRVKNLATGEIVQLDGGDGEAARQLRFTSSGGLLASSGGRLWLWDVAARTRQAILEGVGVFDASPDGSLVAVLRRGSSSPRDSGSVAVHDVGLGTTVELQTHGPSLLSVALCPLKKVVVTGGRDRIVRVGPTSGGEPHLLFGHEGEIRAVAVSPDGRWIVSGSRDGTVRLWPMPEGRPLHTLPHDELLATLRALRSYRVNRDYSDARGNSDEPVPFRGWEVFPEW